MYRKYRTGDLPDIQIKHSELIAPLQAVAQVRSSFDTPNMASCGVKITMVPSVRLNLTRPPSASAVATKSGSFSDYYAYKLNVPLGKCRAQVLPA